MKINKFLGFSVIFISLLISSCPGMDNYWHRYLAPEGGAFYGNIIVTPNNDLIISGGNRLYRSSNHGDSWFCFYESDAIMIADLACNSNGVIFSRNVFYNKDPFINQNIGNVFTYKFYKSNDDGATWDEIHVPSANVLLPANIVVSGTQVFIAFANDSIYSEDYGKRVFYTSDDDGNTWTFVNKVQAFDSAYYASKNDIFAGLSAYKNYLIYYVQGSYHRVDNGYIGDHVRLFISSNQGKDWRTIYLGEQNIRKIYIKSDNEYYVATYKIVPPPNTGIYHTLDSGRSWEIKWFEGTSISDFYCSEDYSFMFVSPGHFKIPLIDRIPLVSNDRGYNWININLENENFDDFNPTTGIGGYVQDSSGYIYCSIGGYGIYRSSNYGRDWVELNKGFNGIFGTCLTFDNFGQLYFTDRFWGLYKFKTNSEKFEYVGLKKYNLGGDPKGNLEFNSKDYIYVLDKGTGYTDQGLLRSTDGGISWKSVLSGTYETFIINKKDYIYVPTIFEGILISKDYGETWSNIWDISGDRLAINDEDDLFVFASEKIFRSTDDGDSWEKVYDGGYIDPGYMSSADRIIFNNKTKSAFYGYIYLMEPWWSGNIKTTDNGRTWFKDNIDFRVNSWAVDSSYCWLASTDNGIYRSCDNGINWKKLDTSGLIGISLGAIGVSPDGYIYGFGVGGLFTNKMITSVSDARNDSTKINIVISKNTELKILIKPKFPNAKIQLYSITGEKILDRDFIDRLDVSFLQIGVYFLKIEDKVFKFLKN